MLPVCQAMITSYGLDAWKRVDVCSAPRFLVVLHGMYRLRLFNGQGGIHRSVSHITIIQMYPR